MQFEVMSINKDRAVLESNHLGGRFMRMELLGNPTGLGRNSQMVILSCFQKVAVDTVTTVSSEEISIEQFMDYGGDAAWVALLNMTVLALLGDRAIMPSSHVAEWIKWAEGSALSDKVLEHLPERRIKL
jgi:hypothetical protein